MMENLKNKKKKIKKKIDVINEVGLFALYLYI